LLIEFNLKLAQPHVKKLLKTPLWELRILGKKSIRFFYFTQAKKTRKTPPKEIKTALNRYKDIS